MLGYILQFQRSGLQVSSQLMGVQRHFIVYVAIYGTWAV